MYFSRKTWGRPAFFEIRLDVGLLSWLLFLFSFISASLPPKLEVDGLPMGPD